jgi:CRISPR-associated protein Csm3
MAQSLKLLKHIGFKATLGCKSGLRIGGTEAEMGIGNAENPVIKDTRGMPYIPGSSLKGKLRSMLEYKYKRENTNPKTPGAPCNCGLELKICPVCTIFGPHNNNTSQLGPSRIIVRDAFLTEKSRDVWDISRKEGGEYFETKTENIIDRRTGRAANQGLRTMERVPAGTEFQLNISVRIFEGDEEPRIKQIIDESLKMLSNDTLGGSGTRGYGWVEIKDIEVKDC